MRYGQSYKKLVDTVKLFHKLRGGLPHPFLHITTTVTYETPEMIQAFQEELSPFVDSIAVGHTNLAHISFEMTKLPEEAKELLDNLKNRQTINEVYSRCNEVFDKISINWDGSVSACCGDYDNYMVVGNLNETTLRDIWQNSLELKNYRDMLKNFRHKELSLCKTCYETIPLRKPL
jgi:radical SAM protein with 4Fe4S-binding SPASM domain